MSISPCCCTPLDTPEISEEDIQGAAELFKALSDPARVRIVNLLATSGDALSITSLTESLGLTQPTVSHHMKKLLASGLIEKKEAGRWAFFSLNQEAIKALAAVTNLKSCGC